MRAVTVLSDKLESTLKSTADARDATGNHTPKVQQPKPQALVRAPLRFSSRHDRKGIPCRATSSSCFGNTQSSSLRIMCLGPRHELCLCRLSITNYPLSTCKLAHPRTGRKIPTAPAFDPSRYSQPRGWFAAVQDHDY